MKILIIRTDIDKMSTSRCFTGIDSAITFELYKKYRCDSNNPCHLHITANHYYSKYTFIDERKSYIGTFDSMDKVFEKNPFLGNVLILTHEQWLDKQNPEWRNNPRYQYW
jgi:hypothetical protein